MLHKYKFCIWLVDTLNNQALNLKEIKDKWLKSSANIDGLPLSSRSFSRYKKTAEMLFDIDIACVKHNNHRYQLVQSSDQNHCLKKQWLISAYRASCLSDMMDKQKHILLEPAPLGASHLLDIINAIDKQLVLDLEYKSHYHSQPKQYEFYPQFVRLFKQRWYVIGLVGDEARTFALERIRQLKTRDVKQPKLTKQQQALFQPESYFNHCYGVIREFEPLKIGFRAFWPQDIYIRDLPIHSSQKVIVTNEAYTDFEIYVRPTYDLKQELLWHRDKLAVLYPEAFKQDIIKILSRTLRAYQTGECQTNE